MTHQKLLKLIESGIPVELAVFHSAVDNGQRVPENQFSMESQNSSRRVEMWATSADLLVYRHNNKIGFTPMANVKFGFFAEVKEVK